MNIKEAEVRSGVSRQNIRFYEREGLLYPERNPINDYREYDEDQILILKQIRLLRTLDLPLEKIRLILRNKLSLEDALMEQKQSLKEQRDRLTSAIRFCDEIRDYPTLRDVPVDRVLDRMEQPGNRGGLFRSWIEDYRKVVLSESQKTFTFIPDIPVNKPSEFTDALFAYANQHKLNLVITREGMNPHFTIDGIEYEAHRVYSNFSRIPTAVIRCRVRYPEDFEPDVPPKRKRILKIVYVASFAALFLALNLSWFLRTWAMEEEPLWYRILAICAVSALALVGLYRIWYFHFNEQQ